MQASITVSAADPSITYSPPSVWSNSNGSMTTTTGGAIVEFSFNGISVEVLGALPSVDQGRPISTYTLDNSTPAVFDSTNFSSNFLGVIFPFYQSFPDPVDGNHALRITSTQNQALFILDSIVYVSEPSDPNFVPSPVIGHSVSAVLSAVSLLSTIPSLSTVPSLSAGPSLSTGHLISTIVPLLSTISSLSAGSPLSTGPSLSTVPSLSADSSLSSGASPPSSPASSQTTKPVASSKHPISGMVGGIIAASVVLIVVALIIFSRWRRRISSSATQDSDSDHSLLPEPFLIESSSKARDEEGILFSGNFRQAPIISLSAPSRLNAISEPSSRSAIWGSIPHSVSTTSTVVGDRSETSYIVEKKVGRKLKSESSLKPAMSAPSRCSTIMSAGSWTSSQEPVPPSSDVPACDNSSRRDEDATSR